MPTQAEPRPASEENRSRSTRRGDVAHHASANAGRIVRAGSVAAGPM